MPSAEVIPLGRAKERRQMVMVRTYGVDEYNLIISELDAHLEAMPWLQEEALARFPHGENLNTFSTVEAGDGHLINRVAPTAALLNFLAICRRAARVRGLRVFMEPPPPPTLQVAQVVEELMNQHGMDARLYEVARAIGLPLPGHPHPMGQGLGPL